MAGMARRSRLPSGLTGWEILVIVLVVGTLAAVLFPILAGQVRVAKDDATAADALDLSLAIRDAYDQEGRVTSVITQDGWHVIDRVQVLEASPGVEVVRFLGTSATRWCVELRHNRGDLAKTQGVRVHSGADEVEYGACAIPAADGA